MTQRLRNLTLDKTNVSEPFLSYNTIIKLDGKVLGGVQNLTIEFDTESLWPVAYIDILCPNSDRDELQESIDKGFIHIFSDKEELSKLYVNSDELYGWEVERGTKLSFAKLSFPVNLSIINNVRDDNIARTEVATVLLRD